MKLVITVTIDLPQHATVHRISDCASFVERSAKSAQLLMYDGARPSSHKVESRYILVQDEDVEPIIVKTNAINEGMFVDLLKQTSEISNG